MPALMHAEPLSSAARSFASSGVAVSEVKVLVHILKVQQVDVIADRAVGSAARRHWEVDSNAGDLTRVAYREQVAWHDPCVRRRAGGPGRGLRRMRSSG